MNGQVPTREPPKILQMQWIQSTNDMLSIELAISSECYLSCTDYRSQCHVLYNFLHLMGFSINKIARLLGVDHKSFEKQLKLPLTSRPNGRPSVLSQEEKQELFEKICEYHNCKIKPTLYDMQQYIITKLKKSISPDTLHNYIIDSEMFKIIKGEPLDEKRYNVDMKDIDNFYANLKNLVDACPASLVFNMDEAGQDEFVDSHSMNVIVPSSCTDATTKIPVRRQCKRSTLVHCICTDGTITKPLLIIPRKTIDSVLLKRLTCNNVMIKFQDKGYANTDLIRKWLEEIFLPTVQEKWIIENRRSGYTGNAVLILDGFSAHAKALSQIQLANYHLSLIFLVPLSSHLCQPLCLSIFCIQKLFTIRRKMSNSLGEQADKIRSIIKGIQESCTTENIISAFESSGIFHYFDQKCTNFNDYMPTCLVIKENARFYKGEGITVPVANFRIGV